MKSPPSKPSFRLFAFASRQTYTYFSQPWTVSKPGCLSDTTMDHGLKQLGIWITIPVVKAAQLWYLLSFYYYENDQLYNCAEFTSVKTSKHKIGRFLHR